MKTSRVWAATGFLLMTLIGETVNAQSANFTMANDTAFTVRSVFYWPSGTNHPGPDRLGNDTIPSGGSYEFFPSEDACIYDIRVRLGDGEYEKQWNEVNLCGLNMFIVHYSYLTRVVSYSQQ